MKQLCIVAMICFGLCLITVCAALAEDDGTQFLPIELTEEELTRLDEIGRGFVPTAPPTGPIRNCAEWEPSLGVIIRWPLGIPYSLVAEMSEDLVVTTIVGSEYQQSQAVSAYTANGVTMANTQFIIAPTNSIWVRDYGPWFIFDGSGDLAIVDHIYNRPRPDDDQIPWVLGSEWSMSVYGLEIVHAGGNHMSDGLGMSMSTELVYDENPGLSPDEIDSMMLAYLGNGYEVLDYIEYGGIHHIDCWAKFLDPATILIKDVPTGDASYDLLNDRAEYLSQKISAWGRLYTFIRVYCPYGTAYTNSLILNDKVFVPTFGSTYDTTALNVYKDAMPGYEVLGFDGSWYDNDAIHCRAMGVPDAGMLEIRHIPLSTTGDTINDYLVSAKITAHSGAALVEDSLKVFYQSKSSFQSASLYATAVPDSFYGYIPAQKPGTHMQYYLQAADYSGRVETHPYIGAPGPHSFVINQPPQVISEDSLFCPGGSEFVYCPEINDADDSIHTVAFSDYPGWMVPQNDSLIGTAPDSNSWTSFVVSVSDPYSTVDQFVSVRVFICGDANVDAAANVADAVYIIAYIFSGGPPPDPEAAGDVNDDGSLNVSDAIYLINFIFKEGPPPVCPSGP